MLVSVEICFSVAAYLFLVKVPAHHSAPSLAALAEGFRADYIQTCIARVVCTSVRTCNIDELCHGRCRGSSATPFQFILIIDGQSHPTPYCWWPSFLGHRCTFLEQSARSLPHLPYSSLPVPVLFSCDCTVPAQWFQVLGHYKVEAILACRAMDRSLSTKKALKPFAFVVKLSGIRVKGVRWPCSTDDVGGHVCHPAAVVGWSVIGSRLTQQSTGRLASAARKVRRSLRERVRWKCNLSLQRCCLAFTHSDVSHRTTSRPWYCVGRRVGANVEGGLKVVVELNSAGVSVRWRLSPRW